AGYSIKLLDYAIRDLNTKIPSDIGFGISNISYEAAVRFSNMTQITEEEYEREWISIVSDFFKNRVFTKPKEERFCFSLNFKLDSFDPRRPMLKAFIKAMNEKDIV